MQIGGSNQSGYDGVLTRPFGTGVTANQNAQDVSDTADDTGDDIGDIVTSLPTQDDAVQISPQGYAANSADDADSSDDTSVDDGIGNDIDNNTDTESADQANAQPVKSLVYGTLGLDRPDQPDDPNQAYSTGRWIAAGITLGGIVSLFV